VTIDQVWLQQSGDDLLLGILGTPDQTKLDDWFAAPSNQLDRMGFSDGTSLDNAEINNLAAAMSAASPPVSTTLIAATRIPWTMPRSALNHSSNFDGAPPDRCRAGSAP
jgi:hypothetical protein